MMKNTALKKTAALLGAACMAWALASCQSSVVTDSVPASEPDKATTAATTGTTAPPANLNPLTGINDIAVGSSVRPVAVMLGNNPKSRPQAGIEQADMYWENETEGGITRVMAVFSGISRVPETLGPIRSARSPFVTAAESLNAVYVHAGGSAIALETLKTAGVGDINALSGSNSAAFWRDAALRQSKGLEYSMMTAGTKLASLMNKRGITDNTDKASSFSFGKGGDNTGTGASVQVRLSGYQTVAFKYNASSGLYTKINGTLGGGEIHVAQSGAAVTASNVLVLYDEKYNEDAAHINFRLQSGSGLLVTAGGSRAVRWACSQKSFHFTEQDGSALRLNPGKVYVCLTDKSNASATVLG